MLVSLEALGTNASNHYAMYSAKQNPKESRILKKKIIALFFKKIPPIYWMTHCISSKITFLSVLKQDDKDKFLNVDQFSFLVLS